MRVGANGLALDRARGLRRQSTPAEQRLWRALRGRGVAGLRVKRQVPLGPWIVDFAIPSIRFVIEIDGESHFSPEGLARDRARTVWLAEDGWRVMRFTNPEVMGNLDGVLMAIAGFVGTDPHPGPLPQAGEGAEL